MEQIEKIQTAPITDAYRSYQGGYFKTLLSPAQTGGALALIDMVLPQGAEPPMHIHTREDETFYIIEGSMGFTIGNDSYTFGEGAAVFAPRMVPHSFKILSPEARFITMITPGDFWNYFMEFSEPCDHTPIVTPPQGPPPAELISRLIDRMENKYAISFVQQR